MKVDAAIRLSYDEAIDGRWHASLSCGGAFFNGEGRTLEAAVNDVMRVFDDLTKLWFMREAAEQIERT